MTASLIASLIGLVKAEPFLEPRSVAVFFITEAHVVPLCDAWLSNNISRPALRDLIGGGVVVEEWDLFSLL